MNSPKPYLEVKLRSQPRFAMQLPKVRERENAKIAHLFKWCSKSKKSSRIFTSFLKIIFSIRICFSNVRKRYGEYIAVSVSVWNPLVGLSKVCEKKGEAFSSIFYIASKSTSSSLSL